jgi:hypothetical protein
MQVYARATIAAMGGCFDPGCKIHLRPPPGEVTASEEHVVDEFPLGLKVPLGIKPIVMYCHILPFSAAIPRGHL